jgi:hypothetical protein
VGRRGLTTLKPMFCSVGPITNRAPPKGENEICARVAWQSCG